MESNTIGRNYAAGVYQLADKHKLHEEFLQAFALLDVVLSDQFVRKFLESPKIATDVKKQALRAALGESVEALFLNFVQLVLDKRRQRHYRSIADEYRTLVDKAAGKLHVQVTLARTPTPEMTEDIRKRLSEIFGNEVIPHVTVDEKIIGGIMVKQGDQVIDGSLRRRLMALRRRLITTHV